MTAEEKKLVINLADEYIKQLISDREADPNMDDVENKIIGMLQFKEFVRLKK